MKTRLAAIALLASGCLLAQQPPVREVVCTDGGSTDTYACTPSPALASYVTGTRLRLYTNTANNGAATVNISSLGAKALKKLSSGITTDLADNDLRAAMFSTWVYDGTNFQMLSQLGNGGSGGGGGKYVLNFHSASTALAAGTTRCPQDLTWGNCSSTGDSFMGYIVPASTITKVWVTGSTPTTPMDSGKRVRCEIVKFTGATGTASATGLYADITPSQTAAYVVSGTGSISFAEGDSFRVECNNDSASVGFDKIRTVAVLVNPT